MHKCLFCANIVNNILWANEIAKKSPLKMRSSGLQTPSGEKEVIFSVWSEWVLAASHPLYVMSCKLGRPWKLCKHVRLSEWGQWNVSTSGEKVNKTQEMRGKVLPVYCGCREENPPRTWLDAFDAICYALPGTVKKSRKISNSSSSFSLSVTLSTLLFLSFSPPSLQITPQSEDLGTVFTSTCWRLGSCQTRRIQKPARHMMMPSRYSAIKKCVCMCCAVSTDASCSLF